MSVEGLLAQLMTLVDEGYRRARDFHTFDMLMDNEVGFDALTVVTDVTLIHPIPEHHGSTLRWAYMHIDSKVAASAIVRVGYTAEADGSGLFTPLGGDFILRTPDIVANLGHPVPFRLDPPFYANYRQGKALTVRIHASGALVGVSLWFRGWDEAYRRVSN